MHFSVKEKETIVKISSGVIHDLPSYLAETVPLKEERNTWATFMGGVVEIPSGITVKMIEDDDALARELSIFIALCYKLQSFQLLQILENAAPKSIPPMLMRKYPSGAQIPPKITNLFVNNRSFEVVPFNELSVLISDDYLTAEERNLQDERNAREKAQRTTVIVAVVSLLISTATSVGTTYFNYKTYSTERKVSIANLDAIKYPIPVSILQASKSGEVTANGSNHSLQGTLRKNSAQRP
ncbi:hypothetical protein [Methylobacter sp.]|uniref:hypothetical protein n=1 Tax=Methylobacter sp. TaxID=2051955 RepID=UPI002FDDFFA9